MGKQERTERLKKLMADNKLNAPAVAALLDRSPQTVRSWACKYDQRAIPATALELLELKLAKQQATE